MLAGITVVALVAAGTWVAVDNSSPPRGSTVPTLGAAGGPRVGDVAPDFALPTLAGGTVRLSDFRGRPVVLNFWAHWCTPCRQEFPLLRAALRRHRDDGLVLVGVDTKDIESRARSFVAKQHAAWPMVLDPDGTLAEAYGIEPIPQTFFIRADGTIAQRVYQGFTDRRDLEHQIALVITP
jgi:peroxiredoxin